MLLQVRRVSTVISRTETRWENAIEKNESTIQMRVQVRVWVWARKLSSVANSTGKLGAPDTENASKQQSNDTQCTAGYGAKRLINLIQFYRSYPCFR